MTHSPGYSLKVTVIVSLVFTWLAFITRITVRMRTVRRLYLDDWLVMLSMIFFTVTGGLYLASLWWGWARKEQDPETRSATNALKTWFFTDIFYTVTIMHLRACACVQIARHATRRWQRLMLFALNVFNLVFSAYMVLALVLRCDPVQWWWRRSAMDAYYPPAAAASDFPSAAAAAAAASTGPGHRTRMPRRGRCHHNWPRRSMYVQSGLGALVDFCIATVPLCIMRDLDMRAVQRAGLAVLVVMAQFAGVAMIARVPAIKGVKYRRNSEGFSLQVGILTTLEPALLLVALCLAALGVFALPGRRGYLGGRRAVPLSAEAARWYDSADGESGAAAGGAAGGGRARTSGGIPLERQAAVALGNRTAVEGGLAARPVEVQRTGPGSKESLAADQRKWEAGIVKTTDVVTYSQDDLAKIARPSSVVKR